MIRLQGMYRLTFPVTPGEVQLRGYGNDTESTTTITLSTKSRMAGRRPKSISFDFVLPGDPQSPLNEVPGYQGPKAWLEGLDRLTPKEVLITIDELDLAWTVLIGPCEGAYKGINGDFYGNIELPLFEKDEFVTYTNQKQLLQPAAVVAKQTKARPNTTGKTAKKKSTSSQSLVASTLQLTQRERIDRKLASLNRAIGT
ncbi:hypothetical protein LOK74_19080 [Brevibacillus humidisoli]|uniref:hypothetical protein n=1 Tax=Brevibacillus humidisoli TaxID=2895522 RepID=UPI001E3E441B|nr:hypothetical protein [Brevibacillus humidisoli]UFJ40118.1 hypothetical protein LOK74_19080 [Brevibacillus humidisoli]